MIADDREKLIKILRMFGSDHDGEVAAAARRAHALLKAHKLDWSEVISAGERRREATGDEGELIKHCLDGAEHLSAWERQFLGSVELSLIEWKRLTPKQRAVLIRIIKKLVHLGAWTGPDFEEQGAA